MRRKFAVVVVVLLIAGLASMAIAQPEETDTKTAAGAIKSDESIRKCNLSDYKESEYGNYVQEMMKSMMPKNMVAAGDGGVIILISDRLLKYDSDLNLKKEVLIPLESEGAFKTMMESMGNLYKDKKPQAPKATPEAEEGQEER